MPRKQDALAHFKRVDPQFYSATKAHHASLPGTLSARNTRAQLFASLVSTVISQQLGLAAAEAIFSRVKKACKGRLTPESILATPPSVFKKAGLSGAKIKTLKEISKAIQNNSLDLLALKKVSEAEAAEQLMRVWGLGPWSSEMFLMFALGRPDVFSVGDLGLIRAMEALYGLPKNAPRSTLLAIAEKWSPYRTYASLLLWRTRDKNN
ncbi:MAG: DNA-3-methyladenine glycosylase 2 family protein [Candidatus Pacebacteria bacterium]|nr:DNA-3-methyladenine glycosylase 2 family protein [Candidatus Paceibacterota bacterium]